MARWSHAMKLSDYEAFEDELQDPGVYELGFVREGFFYPKYVGKAPVTLWSRIRTYGAELGKRSHNAHVASLSLAQFNKVYFHVIRCRGDFAPAVREALLLIRHRYGHGVLYEWNQRYEIQVLLDAGYTVTDVRTRS